MPSPKANVRSIPLVVSGSRRAMAVALLVMTAASRAWGDTSTAGPDRSLADRFLLVNEALPQDWQALPISTLLPAVQRFDYATHSSKDVPEQQLRAQVATYLWKTFLDNADQFNELNAGDQDALVQMVGVLANGFKSDIAQKAAQALAAPFQDKQSLAALDYERLIHLASTLKLLRTPAAVVSSKLTTWCIATDKWRSLDPDDLSFLSSFLQGDTTSDCIALQAAIADKVWTEALSKAEFYAPPIHLNVVQNVVYSYATRYSASQRQFIREHVLKRYEKTDDLAQISVDHANRLVRTLRSVGASDEEVALVLSRWAASRDSRSVYTVIDDGGLIVQAQVLSELDAGAANAKEFAELVQAQVEKEKTLPGPTSAKLLIYMKSSSGSLAQWSKALQAVPVGDQGKDDAGCLRLFAQALAEDVLHPADPGNKAVGFAKQALAQASSDRMCLACVDWLARRLPVLSGADEIKGNIDAAKARLTSPAAQQELELLSLYVRKRAALARDTAAKQLDNSAALQGQLASLHGELARAQQSHRPDVELSAIQRLISNTELQLNTK